LKNNCTGNSFLLPNYNFPKELLGKQLLGKVYTTFHAFHLLSGFIHFLKLRAISQFANFSIAKRKTSRQEIALVYGIVDSRKQ
jgi:hypothetical protein